MRSWRAHLHGLDAVCIVGVTLATTSCANGPAEPDDVEVGPYTEVVCTSFGLSATSGLPLERVSVQGVPASFGSPVAAVMLDDEGEPYDFGYVVEGAGGALELSVPIHPVDPVGGGSVRLVFTDGTSACPAVDFVIGALPEADGEFAAVVRLLQDAVAEQLEIAESTPEELHATPIEDVPPSLWSLALRQTLLDHPANDASLLSFSERGPDDEALDLANRLLARTQLRANLESAALARSTEPVLPIARFSDSDLTCSSDFQAIDPAKNLSDCMELAVRLQQSATGLSREVARDIVQVFSELGGGRNQLPWANEISVLFSAVFWIIYSEREAEGSVYPSRLTSIEVAVDEEVIREDDPSLFSVSAQVTAASLGYNMQEEILAGISEAKRLVDTFGSFDFSTGDPVIDGAANQLSATFASRIQNIDIESLQIPADSFGPVTLRDSLWLDARVVAGDAVTIVGGVQYVGQKQGAATISIRTQDGAFGDDQLADQVDVEVDDIRVSIFPEEALAGDEPELNFEVQVHDAVFPDELEVDRSELQGTADDPVRVADGVYVVTYYPPADPDPDNPDLLIVEHSGMTGAREARAGYDPPRRLAQALIRFGGIEITTSPPDCVEQGGPLQFAAELGDGIDPSRLRWRASAGTMNEETGAFIAPTEAQTVEIVAYLVDAPQVRDSVSIIVGCVCSGSLTVDGSTPTTTFVTFSVLEATGSIAEVGWVHDPVPDDGESFAVTFSFVTPVPVGETLQYEVHAGGLFPAPSGTGVITSSDETGPLTLTMVANEGGERVAGRVTGTVHASWKSGPEPDANHVPLSFTFDVRADASLGWSDGFYGYRECRVGG